MSEPRASCSTCDRPYGRRQRCYYCQPARRRTGETRACETCGDPFRAPAWKIASGQGRFCSYACKNESQRLKGPGAKFKRADGYVVVYYPTHPDSGKRNMVLEHRLVMEQVVGRRLRKGEQVNHINHVRDDNRPENLELVSASDHSRETAMFNNARRRREKVELAEYRKRYGPL